MAETLEQAQERRQAIRYAKAQASTTNLLATGAASFPADETLHASDLDVDHLVLDGMKRRVGSKKWGKRRVPIYDDLNVDVAWSLLDAVVERTIEGASTLTLTIHDPMWVLIGSGLFDTDENLRLDPVDVKLDKLWFRLVQVSPQGSTLTLVFEDRDVWYMRQYDKPRSVSRKNKTRAQFVEMMVREVKQVRIKFFAPEKNKRQPIEHVKRELKVEVTGSSKTLAHAKSLKVKGKRIDAGQRKNIEVAMRGADIEKAGKRPKQAMLVAGIAEGQMRTSALNAGSGAAGPWQLLPSTARNIGFTHKAIQKTARYFLTTGFTGAGGAIDLARKHPDWSPGQIADAIEGGGAGAEFYQKWIDEANAILEAWGDDPNSDVTVSSTRIKQYRFKRGDKGTREDSWTAAQRLAGEVAWRCFSRGGGVWFVSESWLLKQRVLATISRTSDGVDTGSFGFTWDSGKTVQEVTFNISADRWSFPPGSVVQLKGCGPADGRWIVHRISKSLFKSTATITLSKAVKPKPEPAPETTTTDTEVSGGTKGGALRDRIVKEAKASLTSKTGFSRYSQAGRLTADPTPPSGARTDCSQWIRAVYLKAGAGDPGTNTWAQDAKGRRTSKPKPGDLLMMNGHVELYVGAGKCIGHGSAPIDYSTPNDFKGRGPWFVTFDFLDKEDKPKPNAPRRMRTELLQS